MDPLERITLAAATWLGLGITTIAGLGVASGSLFVVQDKATWGDVAPCAAAFVHGLYILLLALILHRLIGRDS